MGKPNERSALFLDRSYIDQKFAELRADMITVMEAKFRVIQNNQDRIIKLLEVGEEPKKRVSQYRMPMPGKLEYAAE
ncbi:hypothetical protein [Clostridium sp. FS41]|uniref:hypothetical protein n=1 Tax=Clostridium sp. FS41 TaxID=1609975 RepID=UPI00061F3548|nr:hypothetical protein [Clostridium sp. FS41]KJJ74745.1 hypothetical protein CLFS41_10130 [Clostridium sp. FS41]